MALALPAIDNPPQRFHFLARGVAQIFRQIGAALGHVAHAFLRVADSVLGLFCPVLQRVFGVVVAASQIATELLARFRGKRQSRQGARTEPNEKESDGGPYVVSLGRFIPSQAHYFDLISTWQKTPGLILLRAAISACSNSSPPQG